MANSPKSQSDTPPQRGLSRRGFLALMGAGGAGAASFGVLTGCSTDAADSDLSYDFYGEQGQELSSRLWTTGQVWAREQGVTSVGVDTAASATHLRTLYARWGFAEVDIIHWEGKVYDSIVMTRPL